jgi:hypothetical protein
VSAAVSSTRGGVSPVEQTRIGNLSIFGVIEHDHRSEVGQLAPQRSDCFAAGGIGDQKARSGLAQLVQQKLALQVRVQRHLGRTRLRYAVEELEKLGAVGGEHRNLFAAANTQLRQPSGKRVRPLIHLGVGVHVLVRRARAGCCQ